MGEGESSAYPDISPLHEPDAQAEDVADFELPDFLNEDDADDVSTNGTGPVRGSGSSTVKTLSAVQPLREVSSPSSDESALLGQSPVSASSRPGLAASGPGDRRGGSMDDLPKFRIPPSELAFRGRLRGDPNAIGPTARLRQAFTPTRPIQTSEHFAGRRWAIQRVITAIEEQQANVVIFGARGVGKTSLTNIISETASHVDYQVHRCPCSSNITFGEIFRGFLRNLPSEFMEREFRARYPSIQNFEQLLPADGFGPTEVTEALHHLKLEHAILIIDEFDRIESTELKNQLAETIKNLSDISARVTFIIVGIGQTLEDLIGGHPSIQRNVVGVHIPLMEPSELQALIELGEEVSGIAFDTITRETIASFSKGLPYYVQLMCLHAGQRAIERGSKVVEINDLRGALEKILQEADPNLIRMYELATHGEQKQFMADVLFASSRCYFDQNGAFSATDAAQVVIDKDGRKIPELSLHKALTSLTLPESGPMLEKRKSPTGVTKYTFLNQMTRQFILVRQARDRGLI